jgi:tetratricopeptide (TPR) repeat protein
MLLFAASFDGQGAIAMRAGKDYAKLTGDPIYQLLTMIRFGRFDEVLAEVTTRPKGDLSGGIWDFAQGYAQLKQGNADFAAVYLARLKKTADTTHDAFRMHTAKNLLGILAGILDGELALANGDPSAAIARFEEAAKIEDSLMYDDPEPLPFAARHWLGAALLEAKRWDDAERVYREELVDHPHNGWSLVGLQQALAGKGQKSADVDADLAASWSRSDTWTRSSRF